MSECTRIWYLFEEFPAWETFVKKFRSTFVRTLRKSDVWRDFESLAQSPAEPTIDYFDVKIGLCRTLDLSFAETRKYILEGLWSWQQADWVSGRVQSNRDELLSDIRNWKRLHIKWQQLFQSVKPSRESDVPKPQQIVVLSTAVETKFTTKSVRSQPWMCRTVKPLLLYLWPQHGPTSHT